MANMVGGYLMVLVALLSRKHVLSYPFGAPASTCFNNFPKHHGVQQQETASPFTLTLSPNTYTGDSVITVTITAPSGRPFVGFQVMAQAQTGNTEDLVGAFPKADIPTEAKGNFYWATQVGSIVNNDPNCVTHSNNAPKMTVSLQWKAPSSGVGNLVFRAGIVENFDTFWATKTTAVLQADDAYTPPVLTSAVNKGLTPPLSLDSDCGRTKGCMLYPSGCHGNECLYAVSYSTIGLSSAMTFEVTGVTPGYLSLAFSDDVGMGKDLTTTCTEKDNTYSIQNGYNPSFYNHQHPIAGSGISNVFIERKGDRLNCRFTRDLNTFTIDHNKKGMAYKIDFPLNKPMYLFLAHGEVYEGTSMPEHHEVLPLVSEGKVDLMKNTIVGARSLHPTLRVHGSLGIVSWIAMVGIAILIARFYKPTLGGKLLGTAVWFQVHRALVVTAMLISIIGIVVIFLYLEAWTKKAAIHAIFGLIAVGLGLAQILSGLLRPHPGTSRRTIFNWFHRSSGMIGFICSAVCVLLAFQVKIIGEPLRMQGTITVASWLGFYAIWFIVLQILHCIRDRNADDVEHVTKNGLSIQDPPSKSGSDMWRVVHLVWLVVGVLVTVALVILMLYFINVA